MVNRYRVQNCPACGNNSLIQKEFRFGIFKILLFVLLFPVSLVFLALLIILHLMKHRYFCSRCGYTAPISPSNTIEVEGEEI